MLFLLGEKRKNTFYDLSYFKIKKCNAVPAAGLMDHEYNPYFLSKYTKEAFQRH